MKRKHGAANDDRNGTGAAVTSKKRSRAATCTDRAPSQTATILSIYTEEIDEEIAAKLECAILDILSTRKPGATC